MFKLNDDVKVTDYIDFDSETAGSRTGERIRMIRTEKGLTQAELGEAVGLNADRIQKYENGVRKPKNELLKKMADVLGVNPLAFTDPNITSKVGAMYGLFELERKYGLKLDVAPAGEGTGITVTFDFKNDMYKYLKAWLDEYASTYAEIEVASSDEERDEIIKAYHDWEWNFPKPLADKTANALKKQRLKDKIEQLQEEYDKL